MAAEKDKTGQDKTGQDKNGQDGQAENMAETGDAAELRRMLEALLFASAEPLTLKMLQEALPPDYAGQSAAVKAALAALEADYRLRGVNLLRRGGAYALRTAADLQFLFKREERSEKKLSRAARETLAVIAYHQPVSRAELEEIRGVETAKGTLDILLETGWVRIAGRREAPGRPTLYATTAAFLDYFNLSAPADLPGLAELKGAGLLSLAPPPELLAEESEAEASAAQTEADSAGETA